MARSKIKGNKLFNASLLFVILLALSIRLGLVYSAPVIHPYDGMWSPIQEAARNIVEGNGCVVSEDGQLVPYYRLSTGDVTLLAGTYWAFGEYNDIYLRIIQAILDSLGCLFMFLIGRMLFNRRVGLIAALFYAVYLPIAYLSTWPLHDALIPLMVLVSLYLFIKAVRTRAVRFYVLSAIVVGISCYFQPSTQLLLVFFAIGLFIYNIHILKLRKNIVKTTKMTAVMMVVFVLVISPCLVRNYRICGVANMRPPGVWQGIWEGFGEFQNPVGAELSDLNTDVLVSKVLGDNVELWSKETDTYFKVKVINTIREYPVWWLSVLIRRIPRTIFNFSELGVQQISLVKDGHDGLLSYLYRDVPGHEIGYRAAINNVIMGIRNGSFWGMIGKYPTGFIYFVMVGFFAFVPALLSIVGVWVLRKRWRLVLLVAIVPVYFSILHILTHTASYKSIVPASLGYIIFSAVASDYIYSRMKGKKSNGS